MGMNMGPRTPPIREDGAFSPPIEQPLAQRAYGQSGTGAMAGGGAGLGGGVGGGGVQRKKSLMQKIKTMVRQRPSAEGGEYVSGPSRTPAVVVSGPMAGQHDLSSPGLSDGGRLEEEPVEGSRERYEDAQDDIFGMSPEVDKGKAMRQGYSGQI